MPAEEIALLSIEEPKTEYTTARNNNDTAWKDVLNAFLPDFVHFCFPELAKLVDWSKPFESLDTELHAITKDASQGTRIVDKLFKLYLLNGEEQAVLFHIDVQGKPKPTFLERIFTYGFRLHDQYQRPLIICAVLTDQDKNWRPDRYEVTFQGTTLSIKYNVIKIIDYRSKRTELEQSTNPFAAVILVQLDAMEAKKKSPKERFDIKLALTERLYKKDFSPEQIIGLYYFIDWLIALPKEFEVQYLQKVYELEEKHHMSYVSNAELFGIEKGILQGIQQGRQEGEQIGWQKGRHEGEAALLIRHLTFKFKQVPENYQQKIQQADAETLLVWGEKILDAKSLEEVFI